MVASGVASKVRSSTLAFQITSALTLKHRGSTSARSNTLSTSACRLKSKTMFIKSVEQVVRARRASRRHLST